MGVTVVLSEEAELEHKAPQPAEIQAWFTSSGLGPQDEPRSAIQGPLSPPHKSVSPPLGGAPCPSSHPTELVLPCFIPIAFKLTSESTFLGRASMT